MKEKCLIAYTVLSAKANAASQFMHLFSDASLSICCEWIVNLQSMKNNLQPINVLSCLNLGICIIVCAIDVMFGLGPQRTRTNTYTYDSG